MVNLGNDLTFIGNTFKFDIVDSNKFHPGFRYKIT